MLSFNWLSLILLFIITYSKALDTQEIRRILQEDDIVKVSELVSILKENPSQMNERSMGGGQTPLMNSCLSGKPNSVRALLEAGAGKTHSSINNIHKSVIEIYSFKFIFFS